MTTTTDDFRRLMDEMAQGSEDAAWELADRYTPHILRAVRASLPRLIRSKIDSQDFAQAVWASILLKRGRLTQFQKPEQFIGYLAATARNKVIDMHRKMSTQKYNVRAETRMTDLEHKAERCHPSAERPKQLPKSKDPTPSQMAIARETWNQLVRRSSQRDQQIVGMRIEGVPYATIADRLSISEKTVQRALHRLLEEFER